MASSWTVSENHRKYSRLKAIVNMAQSFDAQQLATPEAPYIKYLESIKSEWIEAEILERTLKALAKDVKRCHKPVPAPATRSDRTSIAEILDIQVDANGNNKPLQAPNPSLDALDGRVITNSTATSNFLHQLRTCSSNTHTRIIVLHSGRTKLGYSAFDSLFFCHVLGIELNLSPTDVRLLAQLDHGHEDPVQATINSHQLLPMKPGFVSLGFTEETRKRNVGAYLGRKRFGNVSPQVGEFIGVPRSLNLESKANSSQSLFTYTPTTMARRAWDLLLMALSGTLQRLLTT
jgi:hypothetical protein